MKLHNTSSLFQANSIKASTSAQSIKPGQILTGEVIKFFPNNMALIQTNGMKLMAEAEIQLVVNQKYLFQAIKKDHKIQLKILQHGLEKSLVNDLLGLSEEVIKHGNLPKTKKNQRFISTLIKEGIPFTESELIPISNWIDEAEDIPRAIETIRTLIKGNIPIVKMSLEGIYAFLDEEPMSSHLLNLHQLLKEHPLREQEVIAKLMIKVEEILNFDPIHQLFTKERKGSEIFNVMFNNLGLTTQDKGALGGKQEDTLKSLLISSITNFQEDSQLLDRMERLTQRLTGMQLFSQEIGHSQQIVLQFPLRLGDFFSDMTVLWSSQKNSEGKIDPDYCQILFYLELQQIGNTVIDMKIQHRVLNLTIYNKFDNLSGIIKQLKPTLKRNLEQHGYILSNLKLTVPKHDKAGINALLSIKNSFSTNLSGVDLKV